MKNLTDFCKTVETGVDPRLYTIFKMPLWVREKVEIFLCYVFNIGGTLYRHPYSLSRWAKHLSFNCKKSIKRPRQFDCGHQMF